MQQQHYAGCEIVEPIEEERCEKQSTRRMKVLTCDVFRSEVSPVVEGVGRCGDWAIQKSVPENMWFGFEPMDRAESLPEPLVLDKLGPVFANASGGTKGLWFIDKAKYIDGEFRW